jgi:hypothetical protein
MLFMASASATPIDWQVGPPIVNDQAVIALRATAHIPRERQMWLRLLKGITAINKLVLAGSGEDKHWGQDDITDEWLHQYLSRHINLCQVDEDGGQLEEEVGCPHWLPSSILFDAEGSCQCLGRRVRSRRNVNRQQRHDNRGAAPEGRPFFVQPVHV